MISGEIGTVGILNVGHGDTKLSFDKDNPAECIRAARIIRDMLRRGYALMIEQPPGSKKYVRVHEFRDDTFEYVIADFDPVTAQEVEATEQAKAPPEGRTDEPPTAPQDGTPATQTRGRPPRRTRAVPASETRAVAIGRSAGG